MVRSLLVLRSENFAVTRRLDANRTHFARNAVTTRPCYSALLPSPLLTVWPLIRCFRIADGLNTMTRRGDIGTSVPVFER